jgi:hypothetical protein
MVTDGSRIQLTIKPMMPAFKSYHDKIQVMAIFAARGLIELILLFYFSLFCFNSSRV